MFKSFSDEQTDSSPTFGAQNWGTSPFFNADFMDFMYKLYDSFPRTFDAIGNTEILDGSAKVVSTDDILNSSESNVNDARPLTVNTHSLEQLAYPILERQQEGQKPKRKATANLGKSPPLKLSKLPYDSMSEMSAKGS